MIRPATFEDVPRIVALGALMHAESAYRMQPYLPAKVDALMRHLISGAGVVFVSMRGEEIVGGVAGGVTENWFNDELIGFEYGLFLAPHARHGIAATKLILALCAWCKRRGAARLRAGVTTGVQVEGTAALYRSLGFSDGGVFLTKEF